MGKKVFKVKKIFRKGIKDKIMSGEYVVSDSTTGEVIDEKTTRVAQISGEYVDGPFFMWMIGRTDMLSKMGLSVIDFGLLYILFDNMGFQNKIDFSVLSKFVSEVKIKRIRSILAKNNIVRKNKGEWYMNPYIANRNRLCDNSLIKLFDKENNCAN